MSLSLNCYYTLIKQSSQLPLYIVTVLLDHTYQICGIMSVQPTKINITHQPALYAWLLHVSAPVAIVAKYFLTYFKI